MQHITSVVFSHDETRTLANAARFIDLAYPSRDEPLVDQARAVPADDPRRRALAALLSPYDIVSYPRLLAAKEALDAIWERIVVESDASYWAGIAAPDATPDESARAMRHALALATERTGQQRLIIEAAEIIGAALAPMCEADDPAREREKRYAV